VTPYVLIYDSVVLAVPVAFLLHHHLEHGFSRSDVAGLVAASALLLSYLFFTAPVGLAATLIVFALIVRRAIQSRVHVPAVG